MATQSYRPDIEGLRAVAVMGVVIFHVSPNLLDGGFVGVDVFFVISGYLITEGIMARMRKNQFRLRDFYARRIRRLLPAYAAMLLLVYCLAPFTQLPGELAFLGQSAVASALYMSNILFATKDGYFSEQLETSPLLHTWSLSVEEQFYLVFPAVLLLLLRGERPRVFSGLLMLSAASYALAVAVAAVSPTWAFFLSPTRFWQFGAGALLVVCPPLPDKPRLRSRIALAGLAAILASFLLVSEDTGFPTLASLPATLGAAAIIAAGGRERRSIAARILCNRAAQFLGRISYSLYLLHWPIIVFYALRFGPIGAGEEVLLLVTCIVAGALSTHFIEDPFRLTPRAEPATLFRRAGACMAAISAAGLVLVAFEGFPARFTPSDASIAEYASESPVQEDPFGACLLGTSEETDIDQFDVRLCLPRSGKPLRIALVGDSHANHFAPSLRALWPRADIAQITATGCRPLRQTEGDETCTELMRRAYTRYLPEGNFDAILLSARWREEEMAQLTQSLFDLSRLDAKVIVFGPTVEYDVSLPRLLVQDKLPAEARAFDEWSLLDEKRTLDRKIRAAVESSGTRYFSVLDAICAKDTCRTVAAPGVPMQFDYGHLTPAGAASILQAFRRQGLMPRS